MNKALYLTTLLFGLILAQFSLPLRLAYASPVTSPVIVQNNIFSNLSASLNSTNSIFNFSYSGSSSNYHVDLSTLSNMSWDVYLDFATGSNSPITISNPTKWDKYQCNRTLYWRVYNSDRTVSSSIQTTTINCVTPIPTPAGSFTNLSGELAVSSATFNFNPNGAQADYQVDLSTFSDMSWDVYLGFAKGSASSLTVSNPQAKWDKYQCGRTLYFRIYNYNRTLSSPIATTTVNCTSNVFSTVVQTVSNTTNTQPTPIPTAIPLIQRLFNLGATPSNQQVAAASSSATQAEFRPISSGVPLNFLTRTNGILVIVINFFSRLFGMRG